uniref:Uncharacterized protein n=1 Tax=Anguilla anguilla TaxID=7936 RepID=A0A0E9QTX2_ANGAN
MHYLGLFKKLSQFAHKNVHALTLCDSCSQYLS